MLCLDAFKTFKNNAPWSRQNHTLNRKDAARDTTKQTVEKKGFMHGGSPWSETKTSLLVIMHTTTNTNTSHLLSYISAELPDLVVYTGFSSAHTLILNTFECWRQEQGHYSTTCTSLLIFCMRPWKDLRDFQLENKCMSPLKRAATSEKFCC